jgi:Putative SAM-dependent methyltransferase
MQKENRKEQQSEKIGEKCPKRKIWVVAGKKSLKFCDLRPDFSGLTKAAMKDQTVVNIISSTFSTTLSSPLLHDHLQSLKTHLYNRSFAEAFPTSTPTPEDEISADDQQTMLEAYVVRWVPTRVLCYARIFERIASYLPKSEMRVVCVGAGCGSETLALQASLSHQCTLTLC